MPLPRFSPALRLFVLLLISLSLSAPALAQSNLEEQLSIHPASYLAKRARIVGNWENGARIFAQTGLGCTQCHAPQDAQLRLGPDLTSLGQRAQFEHVVQSILDPSAKMENGFKTVRILTVDGVALTGVLRAESDEQLILAIPSEEKPKTIAQDDIDVLAPSESLMPKGLVNQLQDEQEFFDLVRFIVELGVNGPEGSAAQMLQDSAKLAKFELPAYENDLDHRGLISDWNKQSFQRGAEIYAGLCVNCHGTKDKPGSLPNALAFASGKFGNGSDPYSIYMTVTHGYRMMLPQHQLTPRQKYDVINYIREAYVKLHNPSQYVEVDEAYLPVSPKGRSAVRRPASRFPGATWTTVLS